MAKVFVSGSFDPLHSGHVEFFKEASRYGDLYVGIGSDESITKFKHEVFHHSEERLFMIRAIRYVKDANVNTGMGFNDFTSNPFFKECDIFVVNADQESWRKRDLCKKMGKEYIVLERKPAQGLPKRTSTEYRDASNNN